MKRTKPDTAAVTYIVGTLSGDKMQSRTIGRNEKYNVREQNPTLVLIVHSNKHSVLTGEIQKGFSSFPLH